MAEDDLRARAVATRAMPSLAAYEALVDDLLAALAAASTYVPTPDDLDQLCARIAGSAYSSVAVERVEEWTREHWGVESAFTTANR